MAPPLLPSADVINAVSVVASGGVLMLAQLLVNTSHYIVLYSSPHLTPSHSILLQLTTAYYILLHFTTSCYYSLLQLTTAYCVFIRTGNDDRTLDAEHGSVQLTDAHRRHYAYGSCCYTYPSSHV